MNSVQENLAEVFIISTSDTLNNTLPGRCNKLTWRSPEKHSRLPYHNDQTFGHSVGRSKSSLDQERYTWQHDSILDIIVNTLSRFCKNVYADVTSFASLRIVAEDYGKHDKVLFFRRMSSQS